MEARVIHEDVSIRAIETPVEHEGKTLIERTWFLLGPADVLIPGSKLFVKTRKPWPAHCAVLGVVTDVPAEIKKALSNEVKFPRGTVVTKFDFVPRDETKRVNATMKVTTSDRMNALESQNANLLTQNAELLKGFAAMQASFEALVKRDNPKGK